MNTRLTGREKIPEDAIDTHLRPQRLEEFVGQSKAKQNLRVFIEAAKARGEALDHVLFAGPPGLGKTTLAQIMSRELGVNFKATSGPVIAKAGDLAALLTNLEDRDVLFIDEIHRLNPAVEEVLYPAMEDFQLDLIIGEGPAARSVPHRPCEVHPGRRHDAHRPSHHAAARPLRHSRPARLLRRGRAARDREARRAGHAGERSRKMARARSPSVRAARRASPDGCCAGCAILPPWPAPRPSTAPLADRALRSLDVDDRGLDALDHRYLACIAGNFGGGPVGIDTIAASLSEARDAIEDIVEPYLLQLGFLNRTPRGRLLTAHAFRHLGLAVPQRPEIAQGLLPLDGGDD